MATQYTGGLVAGSILTSAIMNQLGAAWETYTPTWGALSVNPVLGNGTLTGTYCQIQKIIIAEARLVTGSTTTYGTGIYSISLPVNAKANTTPRKIFGIARLYDTSAAVNYNFGVEQSGNNVVFTVNAGAFMNPTVPVTMANGDSLSFVAVYEAA